MVIKTSNIPKVSVIVPAYNEEKFIGRAIRSILSNSIDKNDFEVLVVDDASTDQTVECLKPFENEITLIKNRVNKGLPSALNAGIKQSRGRYIVRVDADDYVHADYLYILSLHLQLNNDLDAVACDYSLVDQKQRLIRNVSCEESPIGCGIMYRKEQLIDIGLYDERFRLKEDEDLRIRFCKKYSIYRIPLPLYKYRQHKNNSSSDTEAMKRFGILLEDKHNVC